MNQKSKTQPKRQGDDVVFVLNELFMYDWRMTLEKYFSTEPWGAKAEMANYLGISPEWMSKLIAGTHLASPKLAVRIEEATQGLVTRKELRPDLFS